MTCIHNFAKTIYSDLLTTSLGRIKFKFKISSLTCQNSQSLIQSGQRYWFILSFTSDVRFLYTLIGCEHDIDWKKKKGKFLRVSTCSINLIYSDFRLDVISKAGFTIQSNKFSNEINVRCRYEFTPILVGRTVCLHYWRLFLYERNFKYLKKGKVNVNWTIMPSFLLEPSSKTDISFFWSDKSFSTSYHTERIIGIVVLISSSRFYQPHL